MELHFRFWQCSLVGRLLQGTLVSLDVYTLVRSSTSWTLASHVDTLARDSSSTLVGHCASVQHSGHSSRVPACRTQRIVPGAELEGRCHGPSERRWRGGELAALGLRIGHRDTRRERQRRAPTAQRVDSKAKARRNARPGWVSPSSVVTLLFDRGAGRIRRQAITSRWFEVHFVRTNSQNLFRTKAFLNCTVVVVPYTLLALVVAFRGRRKGHSCFEGHLPWQAQEIGHLRVDVRNSGHAQQFGHGRDLCVFSSQALGETLGDIFWHLDFLNACMTKNTNSWKFHCLPPPHRSTWDRHVLRRSPGTCSCPRPPSTAALLCQDPR